MGLPLETGASLFAMRTGAHHAHYIAGSPGKQQPSAPSFAFRTLFGQTAPSMASGSDYVQSLARGLSVIRAFDEEHRELTLSEVARAAGLTRAAARRFLLTLVELGYMHFDGGRFSLR